MKFTMSQDGVKRTDIKVVFRLEKTELVNALAMEVQSFETLDNLPEEMGVREVTKRIQTSLRFDGEGSLWGKEISEEYQEWAQRQIDRLFPDA